MTYEVTAGALHVERLPGNMALIVLHTPEVAAAALPGQFVMVRCGDLTLRRPLSIHAAYGERIALLFRIMGGGTEWLAGASAGDPIQLMGPSGNGYTLPSAGESVLLVAGGMGIAPLSFLATRMPAECDVALAYGARSTVEVYHPSERLRALIPSIARMDSIHTLLATDDGSLGECGSALDLALPLLEQAQRVFLCGPVGMCVAASRYAAEEADIKNEARGSACSTQSAVRLMDAQVSLEVRMACGIGACYACSISTRLGRRKVCTDGPVFRFGDVLWDEVRT